MSTILIALLFFSIIIVVHELGHFLAARMVGIHAEEFSIGMGPALFKFSRNGTLYCLRILPIGGYVKFIGEDNRSDDSRAFSNAKLWKRILVVASGSIMNFFLAIVLLTAFFVAFGTFLAVPEVFEIGENTPAQQAGLLPGDRIVRINETSVNFEQPLEGITQIRTLIDQKQGRLIQMIIERDGEEIRVDITPRLDVETGRYKIGVVFGRIQRHNLFSAIGLSFVQTGRIIILMVDTLGGLIFRGEGVGEVIGPVGIVGEIGRAVQAGIEQLINLAIIITINLGIINLIPFPALDGGRLALMLVEGVRGKSLDPQKEGYIHLAGFVILMTLMALITFRDIAR